MHLHYRSLTAARLSKIPDLSSDTLVSPPDNVPSVSLPSVKRHSEFWIILYGNLNCSRVILHFFEGNNRLK